MPGVLVGYWRWNAASTLPIPITPVCFCQGICYWSNGWFCTGHLIGSPWNPFSVLWFHCMSSPNSGIGESSMCLCGGVCPWVMGHPVFQAPFPLQRVARTRQELGAETAASLWSIAGCTRDLWCSLFNCKLKAHSSPLPQIDRLMFEQ